VHIFIACVLILNANLKVDNQKMGWKHLIKFKNIVFLCGGIQNKGLRAKLNTTTLPTNNLKYANSRWMTPLQVPHKCFRVLFENVLDFRVLDLASYIFGHQFKTGATYL
jgi:hypothetical protein